MFAADAVAERRENQAVTMKIGRNEEDRTANRVQAIGSRLKRVSSAKRNQSAAAATQSSTAAASRVVSLSGPNNAEPCGINARAASRKNRCGARNTRSPTE